MRAHILVLLVVLSTMLAQFQQPPDPPGTVRQCCKCCFGARQEHKGDCVEIMGVNKCRERGGVCFSLFPCFGRD